MSLTYEDEHGYLWFKGNAFSGYLWISFADEEEFLGVIVTKPDEVSDKFNNMISAIKKTKRMGINPGGSVHCLPIGSAEVESVLIEDYTDRLLDKDEALFLQDCFTKENDKLIRSHA